MTQATTTMPQAGSAAVRMAQVARASGVPSDQLKLLLSLGYVPQARQLAFHGAARACDLPGGPTEVGYGGARGGGKSHCSFAQLVDDCLRYDGLKALYLRKVGKAIREAFEDLRLKLLLAMPHDYNRQEGVLTFLNGSKIYLGHFKDERDIDNYLGLEYDVIAIEEATMLTKRKYEAIRTCNRTSKAGWRPRIYSTTNPGGVGHAWYKALFIEPHRQGKTVLAPAAQRGDTRFIPATVYDNAFVNPDYRKTLQSLTGWLKQAWLYGDWDIAAGQFFTTYRRETHVITPFLIPVGWRVWAAMDYGRTHYTVVHLFAESDDRDVYVVGEHAERRWLPDRHAPAIRAMFARAGVDERRVKPIKAGHDVFAQGHDSAGRTIADQYHALGFRLEPANTDRINGAAEILKRLGDVESVPPVRPSMWIFDTCPRLIETLPAMQHDPHRPEDVLKVDCDDDGAGGDDAYDSARYGLMEAASRAWDKDALQKLGGPAV